MKLFLATNNPDKAQEIGNILEPHEILIPSLLQIEYSARETGNTYKDNALIKAKELYKKVHNPVIADDTGLSCDFLNGEPGVFSARFAGKNASYKDNRMKLIELAKKIPPEKRTAHFITVAVIMLDEENVYFFEGKVYGIILTEEKGFSGFGYDPIFYYPPLNATFAEIPEEVKNSISHRFRAFQKLKEFLNSLR